MLIRTAEYLATTLISRGYINRGMGFMPKYNLV
jgi:hypothetical protein